MEGSRANSAEQSAEPNGSVIPDESGAETSRKPTTSLPRCNPNQYLIAVLAALGCAAESYALYSFKYVRTEEDTPLWFESFIGACVGSLLILALMHTCGRKISAAAIATMYVLYFMMRLFRSPSKWLRVGAFFVGIGTGGIYVVIPTYLVEIAEENSRGKMGVIMLVMKIFGYFMACLLDLISRRWIEHFLSLVFGVLFLAASMWMPETPYFLISTGHRDEALRSLRRLRGDVVEAQQNLQVLEESTQEYARRYSTWVSRLVNREAMVAVAVAGGLMILQIVRQPFMKNLFLLLYSELDVPASLCVIYLLLLLLTFVPLFLVDRIQRRLLLMLSAAGTAACSGVLALTLLYEDHLVVKTFIEFVLVITRYLGIDCLPFIISAELMPNGVRAVGCGIVVCMYSICTYIATKIFIVVNINTTFYLVASCGFSISCIIYVIFVLPETKGKIL